MSYRKAGTLSANVGWIMLAIIALWDLPQARAHYLWVVADMAQQATDVRMIFEEAPVPRDGEYLEPFVKDGKAWVRTLNSDEPSNIELKKIERDGKKWLQGQIKTSKPRSIEGYGLFGVYQYGKTHALLHYYAKHLQLTDHDDLHDLGRSPRLDLDIEPHDTPEGLELKVFWKNKPAQGVKVNIRGPKGFLKSEATDANGMIRVATDHEGRYLIRATRIDRTQQGTHQGKAYDHVRHSTTLVMSWPVD